MGIMAEVVEVNVSPPTRRPEKKNPTPPPPIICPPPFQSRSSRTLSALLESAPKTPMSPFLGRIMSSSSPLASPLKRAVSSVKGYLEEVGHFTRLINPQEAWLPITESRNGNAYYAAFHTLSSGIGFQALVLPLAFAYLGGWTWGIICLSLAFVWQLYTLWLLIQLHESTEGTRYSRYLHLSIAAFGKKVGKLLVLLPTMFLSGGTCVALIMIGGETMKIFVYEIVCGTQSCNNINPLITTVEWYLMFTILAVVLAQLPNLNSIAGVSLIGAITAVAVTSLIWTVSVAKGKPVDVSDGPSPSPLEVESDVGRVCTVLNGLGIIAFAFRGHNLVLEIQGTMPSSPLRPSRIPMWKGVKFSYLIIATCLFPLAIGGYWAYGTSIPTNGGMLTALHKYHRKDTSMVVLGLTSLLFVINCLTSFQIYAMPVFDNLESKYTTNMNKPCPRWLRTGIRVFFGCLAFFIAVALPFLPRLAWLLGGIALPITGAYPCFMWIMMKKPGKYSGMWWLNWVLGCLGMVLSVLLIFGAIWSIVAFGIEVHFFKPQ